MGEVGGGMLLAYGSMEVGIMRASSGYLCNCLLRYFIGFDFHKVGGQIVRHASECV